jgi:hypothetical protein
MQDIIETCKLNCHILSTIQKEKCFIQLVDYFTQRYPITKEECIKMYLNASKCIFLTNGKRCDKPYHMDRLCKIHHKKVNKL